MNKRKYLADGPRVFRNNKAQYVRAWREKREFVVQIWAGDKAEGEPPADWAMPVVLGLDASIQQAFVQTDWSKP